MLLSLIQGSKFSLWPACSSILFTNTFLISQYHWLVKKCECYLVKSVYTILHKHRFYIKTSTCDMWELTELGSQYVLTKSHTPTHFIICFSKKLIFVISKNLIWGMYDAEWLLLRRYLQWGHPEESGQGCSTCLAGCKPSWVLGCNRWRRKRPRAPSAQWLSPRADRLKCLCNQTARINGKGF